MLIMDEADEMLSRGFVDDMRDIVRDVPPDCQIGVFSATFQPDTLELCQRFVRKPVRLLLKQETLTLAGIYQFYVAVGDDRYKAETLADLYGDVSTSQSVVFCATRRRVDALCDFLSAQQFSPAAVHSDLTHAEREDVLARFVRGETRVLVTTDLCSRGIDVHGVSVVVNYDLPRDPATYLHRIGRAGRFGRKGLAINLVADSDIAQLRQIERFYHTSIDELPRDFSTLMS
jgi:translation initiation factor 4A